jgi:hypothetical protein
MSIAILDHGPRSERHSERKERQQVIGDPVLAAACHEAARAVASIVLSVPFAYADIGLGEAGLSGGSVVGDGKPC